MTSDHANHEPPQSNGQAISDHQDFGLQFGLTDLFFLMAFGATIALAYSSRWTTASTFAGALLFAAIVGWLFVVAGRKKRFVIGSVLIALICLGAFFLTAAAIVFLHGIASLFLCFNQGLQLKKITLIRISMVIIAIAMFTATFGQPRRLTLLLEGREEFPIENLSSRLSYELEPGKSEIESSSEFELASHVSSRLVSMESEPDKNPMGRVWALEKLHNKSYERFVRSLGFGIVRMIPASSYRARAPRIPMIGLDGLAIEEPGLDHEREPKWRYTLPGADEIGVMDGSLLKMPREFHERSELDFLLPESFGFIQSKNQVAGFSSHAFHFPTIPLDDEQDGTWVLKNLQLISLLKFDEPRAYVLDHLPRMDHLTSDQIPTRRLDSFEKVALSDLLADEDYVINETATTIRMLGSLRAARDCLDCHSVRRGELLGAFTYEFERD